MNPLALEKAVVVFDMDGVLNKFDFGELGIKIIEEHEWAEANMERDMYKYVEKTNLFDMLINTKNPMDMYVISQALTSFEQNNKLAFLEENYPNIRPEHVIFVGDTKFKIDVLKGIRKMLDKEDKSYKDLVIIEDSIQVLIDVVKLGNPGIKCHLISDFI